jgi:hypothetical protein
MAAFLAELKADFQSKIPLVVWITVSLAVAISGPFGSYSTLSLLERLCFWTPAVGVGLLIGSVVRAFVYGTLALKGFFSGSLLITALVCIAVCPPLYGVVKLLFDPMFGGLVGFVDIFLLVSTISLGVCALRISTDAPRDPASEPSTEIDYRPRLLRRIDPTMHGDIWAITVRDHYVDVQTSLGKASLLLRFADAVAEAEPTLGTQVHRSHWVAWQGVGSVCREGGKVMLHLKNGSQIPVSRNHRDKVDTRFPPHPQIKAAAA